MKQRRIRDQKDFWDKVSIGAPNECWEWAAGRFSNGYGSYRNGTQDRGAHVIAYELSNQCCILPGYVIRHAVCDNPPCCNPRHLKLGTQKDNIHDSVRQGRHNYGEKHGYSKLTEQNVIEIRRRGINGETPQEIAKDYPVTYQNVYRILKNITWRHLL